MKKFFSSLCTLLLLFSSVLHATPTIDLEVKVSVYNSAKVNEQNQLTDEAVTKMMVMALNLLDKKQYINQVITILKEHFNHHVFLFPWTKYTGEKDYYFDLGALIDSPFPITKQCNSQLEIYVLEEKGVKEGLVADPKAFFKEPKNWQKEWGPFDQRGEESDPSPSVLYADSKKSTLLQYTGGVILFMLLLAGGCYALYRPVKLKKKAAIDKEKKEKSPKDAAAKLWASQQGKKRAPTLY